MTVRALVEVEPAGELEELFAELSAAADTLKQEDIAFEAKAKATRRFSSGLPEISELVLALGSAGVFTALSTVLKKFFAERPTGRVHLKAVDGDRTITITAENCNASELTKRLGPLMKRL
jgi:Effector Associated Constant Component 1